MTRWATGLAELAQHYDGFVLDQFGVLHNGQQLYPGVLHALQQLREQGKPVVVLSNSGKRAAHNSQRLQRFGIGADLFDSVISSGELCWQMLQRRDRSPWATMGHRAYLINSEQDSPMLNGLHVERVDEVALADFILLASLPDAMQPEALTPLLTVAAHRGLPMVCANPDRHRLTPRGNEPSSGAVAALYETLGGAVVWCGKPYPAIYQACSERLAELGATQVCAVGDSLEHDVLGGSRANLATCFISGGLYAQDFAQAGPAHADQVLARLLASPEAHGAPAPVWALDTLHW